MKFHKTRNLKKSSIETLTILLLCFSILLSSCAYSSSDINEHSLYLPSATDKSSSEKTDFFFFIIPKDASAELIESAKGLCEKFRVENGVKAQVYFDNELLPTYKDPRFILIGNTSHFSSQKAISHLKRDDYVCLSIEKDVVIGGKSSSASILAIERFTNEILPYFDGESGISAASAFEFFAEYPHKDLTINGYSLSDYKFVYPSENSMREMELVYLLREKLAGTCGAYPEIIPDDKADETDRLICVGNCFGYTRVEPQIAYEGNSVKLFADSANTLAHAAQALIKESELSQSIILRESTVIESKTPIIDFRSVLADRIENESDLTGIVNVCKEIKQTLPMLVCFDLPSNTELEAYKKNLNEYTYIGNGLFVLSNKNEIISVKTEGNVSVADIRIGEGFDYRVVVAHTRYQNNDELSSNISNDIVTVLFAVSNVQVGPSVERNDTVLEIEKTDGDRSIYTKAFAPIGTASVQEQTIVINHSLLKEAILR